MFVSEPGSFTAIIDQNAKEMEVIVKGCKKTYFVMFILLLVNQGKLILPSLTYYTGCDEAFAVPRFLAGRLVLNIRDD